jgi:hypothetical protein
MAAILPSDFAVLNCGHKAILLLVVFRKHQSIFVLILLLPKLEAVEQYLLRHPCKSLVSFAVPKLDLPPLSSR